MDRMNKTASLPVGEIVGIQGPVITLITVFWFEIPSRGELLTLYSGVFLFLLLAPEIILSGFATPIENMPDAVQTLTYISPLRYFM